MSIVYDHPIGYVIENTLLFGFYGCQATVSQARLLSKISQNNLQLFHCFLFSKQNNS